MSNVQGARGMNPADQKALLGMLQGVSGWSYGMVMAWWKSAIWQPAEYCTN